MVSTRWCCKQKDGIKLAKPSENLAKSYFIMAENSLGTMNRRKKYNLSFSIAACYYSMYYSLYAIMIGIGIKCEIHSCSLRFMKEFLRDYYSTTDVNLIEKAFELRGVAQYYADKVLDMKDVNYIIGEAPSFFSKSKDIFSKMTIIEAGYIGSKIEAIQHGI